MKSFAIHGTGRMAKAICDAAECRDDLQLIGLAGPQAPAWKTGLPWAPALEELPETPDFLIDFTLPAGTAHAADWCLRSAVPLVSGVTGLTEAARDLLQDAAEVVPVLWSPNLSLGVNLLAELAQRAAAVLDSETAVAIEDIHHQWKKDAPSGTALMFGEAIAAERNGDASRIDYHSIREGEIIGEHTVRFRMAGEEFDLVHRAHDRSIYALGALDAGNWLTTQTPGLYSARDWIAGR